MGKYLIYSREHNAWWRPNSCGYAVTESWAGRYSHDEAARICADACRGRTGESGDGPPEFMYDAPESIAAALKAAREALDAARERMCHYVPRDDGIITLIDTALRLLAPEGER